MFTLAIFRVEKTRDYTTMSNHHLKNRNLSLKAVGIMSKILSLPDDWDYTLRGLSKLTADGIDSVRAAIRELEAAGYKPSVRDRLKTEQKVQRTTPSINKSKGKEMEI